MASAHGAGVDGPGRASALDSSKRACRRPWSADAAAAALVVLVLLSVWPLARVVFDMARGLMAEGMPGGAFEGAGLRRLGGSSLIAGIIAAISVMLAWPAAWVMRRRPMTWAPVVVVPMLLPMYLAYTGWGVMRSPGTMLGDHLARGSVARIRAFEHILALGSLSLWAWPIAAMVLVVGFRRISPEVFDALRLDAVSRIQRAFVVLRMMAGHVAGAWVLVGLMMLGSAVPLHLAQIDTLTMSIWLEISQSPPDVWWRSWVKAWPLLVLACAGAWVLSGRLVCVRGGGFVAQPKGGRGIWLMSSACVVWAASVAAPAVLLAWSLREWASIARFIRANDEALVRSAAVAGATGLVCAAIAGLVSMCASCGGGRRALARVVARMLVVVGLMPGVLVGVAMVSGWNSAASLRWMLDSSAVVVLGNVARYGFIAALAGWWLAESESASLRSPRRLDGAVGAWGWIRACLPWQAGGLAGVGLASAALSLHEIEAATMLDPPGHDSLSRLMLNLLHFARVEDLSAGALVVLAGAAIIAFGAAAALRATSMRAD